MGRPRTRPRRLNRANDRDGEWAEAMCGLGGVARLMPALQHTRAWMRGSIHVENMEATSEAWQGCPRSPRPQKLDRLAWHAPGSVYAVHVRQCVRSAALKLKAGGEQLGTRCKLRALKSPDKADEVWTIEKRRIDQIFAVTNHSHFGASHPNFGAYQLPTSPARSFRPARVSVPVLSSRAEKAETLAVGRGQWAARHFAPVFRTENGLICEHRGQAERGWRFAPTVHIAARSMAPRAAQYVAVLDRARPQARTSCLPSGRASSKPR